MTGDFASEVFREWGHTLEYLPFVMVGYILCAIAWDVWKEGRHRKNGRAK